MFNYDANLTSVIAMEQRFGKGTYHYEYMDGWEKTNETSLRKKGEFYSNLNMDDITDANYLHVKRIKKSL